MSFPIACAEYLDARRITGRRGCMPTGCWWRDRGHVAWYPYAYRLWCTAFGAHRTSQRHADRRASAPKIRP